MAKKTEQDREKTAVLLPGRDAFTVRQMDLFQSFLCNTEEQRDGLSNTIELWDSLPKYAISPRTMHARRTEEGLLPRLEKNFVYKKQEYKVRITAAIIDDPGKGDVAFYPGANEELVEDALRKIAADQYRGFFDQPRHNSGVVFSLHMLRNELKKRGHARSYQEIVQSLKILSGSHIEIMLGNGSAIAKSNFLPSLAGVSRAAFLEHPSSKWIAHFHPLVTESIDSLSYRQFNYHQMMSHSSQLARWLHKLLSHNYINASYTVPYVTDLSDLKRDSGGLLDWKRTNDVVRRLEKALDELVHNNVLLSFQKQESRGERNKILDVRYSLTPHMDFVKEVKAANKRQDDGRKKLESASRAIR